MFSGIDILAETKWLEQVGLPVVEDTAIVVVRSWDEALAPLTAGDYEIYGPNGHLEKPSQRCIDALESDEHLKTWWEKARSDVNEYYDHTAFIPNDLSSAQQEFIYEYIYEFVSFLLAEIIAAPTVETSYFREMLPWFYAGHFPCGWVGQWPEGHMRVY